MLLAKLKTICYFLFVFTAVTATRLIKTGSITDVFV